MKTDICKELAHRMDHSKQNQCILCPRRLEPPCDDCTVRVQWFSSVKYFVIYNNTLNILTCKSKWVFNKMLLVKRFRIDPVTGPRSAALVEGSVNAAARGPLSGPIQNHFRTWSLQLTSDL